MAKLILSLDGLVLNEFPLTKERTSIGRKPHNDIQIDNLAVSGEHAVVVTIGERLLPGRRRQHQRDAGQRCAGQEAHPAEQRRHRTGQVQADVRRQESCAGSAADYEKTMVWRPAEAKQAAAQSSAATSSRSASGDPAPNCNAAPAPGAQSRAGARCRVEESATRRSRSGNSCFVLLVILDCRLPDLRHARLMPTAAFASRAPGWRRRHPETGSGLDIVTRVPPTAREAVRRLRASKIREVANAGMGREDVLAFWFGEPDEVTPAFIRQAGIDALQCRRDVLYAQPRHSRAAAGDRGLRLAPASARRGRPHRGHELRDVGADAGDAGAGRAGRPRRRGHAALAQPGRDSEDPRRGGRPASS